jgi:nitroimidazol reductase NimA-like FMN-containing flavoprotein (pyridoxamine 5'-phosphate oxidase superfamily)
MSFLVPTDRRGMVVLTTEECEKRLSSTPIGRLGVVVAGEPMMFPVLFRFVDGAIVFRTAAGEKMDAVWIGAAVTFEIDGWDSEKRVGWSVIARGRAETVHDPKETRKFEALGLDDWVPRQQPTTWVRLRPAEVSGRRIPEQHEQLAYWSRASARLDTDVSKDPGWSMLMWSA